MPRPDELFAHCANCEDTGFVRGLDCPGDGRCHIGRCGQLAHVSYPHGYTRACHCRATNPALIQAREWMNARAKTETRHREEH